MVPLNLDQGQEALFWKVHTVLQNKNSLNVNLQNKQQAFNLAIWLADKGHNVKNLLLENALKISSKDTKFQVNDFLKDLESESPAFVSTIYIKKQNLPLDTRCFLNYLKFTPSSDDKYFIKFCTETRFQLRELCKAFKTDSLKMISYLLEHNYISVDFSCCDCDFSSLSKEHYKYLQEGATFSLTKDFYYMLLNTSPKANQFSLKNFNSSLGETNLGKFSNAA